MQTPTIPTYASDGRRIRSYSDEAVRHLEALSMVVCRRNRRGEIVAAFFRPQDGANPLKATCNMGQRYSFLEAVGTRGERAWSHKSLLQRQDIEQLTGIPLDSPKDLDLYLRGIFRGVALSCIRPADPPAPPAPANVVDISTHRPGSSSAKRRRRPVEFASEDRKAA